MSSPWTLSARWIFPVDQPPLERGTITIHGDRIVAVRARDTRVPDVDLGDVAVIPGLVNAHTHLDLSGARGRIPPDADFTTWLRKVIQYRRSLTADQVDADIRAGLAESLAFGTTLLGDISGDGASWDIVAGSLVRAVIFRELLGLPKERAARALAKSDAWLGQRRATPTCRPGISPHAPYSVRVALFLAASTAAVPAAVHLAESAAEIELLGHRRGPFVSFLRELGAWDPHGLAEDADHVLRLFNGLAPALFVHGNYLGVEAPIPANGSIVYCPRTHASFAHRPHPFRAFLARGVRVALGTDSLASNPDLSVLEEARFLHHRFPDVPGSLVLRMATLSGAEALGWYDETGSLSPGKSADLVVVPVSSPDSADPYHHVLGSSAPVEKVMFQGRWTYDRAAGILPAAGRPSSA
jgi:cytosine/adenosine deaminase-related metal-dependent hydrolase